MNISILTLACLRTDHIAMGIWIGLDRAATPLLQLRQRDFGNFRNVRQPIEDRRMQQKPDPEEVTFAGFLTATNSMPPSVDTSRRFSVADVKKRRYRCPVCTTETTI
jgi:hypothetical protein